MRGGFVHNRVLIAPVESAFRILGASVHREHPVGSGGCHGFVDLWVIYLACRIACEAEMSSDRVWRDMEKAILLKATLLLILVPKAGVAESVRSRLASSQAPPVPSSLSIYCLTVGAVLHEIRTKSLFMSVPIVPETSIHLTQIDNPIHAARFAGAERSQS